MSVNTEMIMLGVRGGEGGVPPNRFRVLDRYTLLAFSLANLCLLGSWIETSDPTRSYWGFASGMKNCTALILSTGLLTAVFRAGHFLARWMLGKRGRTIGQIAFLLVLLIPLNTVRIQFRGLLFPSLSERLGIPGLRVIMVSAAVLSAVVVLRWFDQVVGRLAWAAVAMSALGPILFLHSGWVLLRATGAKKSASIAVVAHSVAADDLQPRVVWLVYDEMDARIAFFERPASLKLPEFDRFRSESVFATNAYPPAIWTLLSLPSLITGKLISQARPVGSDELMVTFADSGQAVPWSKQANVFSKAGEAGFNTGLVGWAHPYCRVIGNTLNACSWHKDRSDPEERGVHEVVLDHLRGTVDSLPFVWHASAGMRRQQWRDMYLRILQDARRLATNRALGLVLVHWCVPHLPAIYDRFAGDFSLEGRSGYLDNLALADRSLGELRRTMEAAGTWEQTTIFITSDHALRANAKDLLPRWASEEAALFAGRMDKRVPFLVKMGGQHQAFTYANRFGTLAMHEATLAILRKEVSSPEALMNWLDDHRFDAPKASAQRAPASNQSR